MPLELYALMDYLRNNNFNKLTQLKLNVDSYRIYLKHKYDPISVVAIGKIDPLPHQVEAFVKMMTLLRPQSGIEGRIRMLLADDVGLGKTIMIGLVMKELILRKKINRVLIVAPSSLQIQWQEELEEKFNEHFEIIRGQLVGNPYLETNRAIISVDTARNTEKLDLLKQSSWDLVIFDEAHKLKPGSLRYELLAKELSKRTKHLILASATPHDGKVENFMALIKLIDNDVETNLSSNSGFKKYLDPLMIRRLKEDVIDFQGKKVFPKRDVPQTVEIEYSPDEKDFYDAVEDYVNTYYKLADERGQTTAILALYILHRRVSSSIQAGYLSLVKRKMKLLEPYIEMDANQELNYLDYLEDLDGENEVKKEKSEEILLGATASAGDELRVELERLDTLINMGKKLLENNQDYKYKKLLDLLKNIQTERPGDKVIIFTEFADTLYFIRNRLIREGYIVSTIKGGMTIEEKKEQSVFFENKASILLGTETAGEGLNLQFANIVINYELPWNPNRLEQRIGRVYRYGQKKPVFIYNFKTAFAIDDAVFNKILEKMENIRAVFGDSAVNVIGSLISEKEMFDIFKATRAQVSAIDKVDQVLSEKVKILKDIEQFLIKDKFNLINVQGMTKDITRCINNFDIERFFLTYMAFNYPGNYGALGDNQYHFDLTALDKKIDTSEVLCEKLEPIVAQNYSFNGSFDVNKNGKYIALGHPALSYAINDSMKCNSISYGFYPEVSEDTVVTTYIIKFYNGLKKEIYSEPILLLKNEKETKILDPLAIWDIQEIDKEELPEINPESYNNLLQGIVEDPISVLKGKTDDLENFVKVKNVKDLISEYNFFYSEYDWKIKNLKVKREEHAQRGQNYLLAGIDERIDQLKKEFNKLIEDNTKSRSISWDICGPIDVVLLIPPQTIVRKISTGPKQIELEKIKQEIERLGMDFVMDYERKHGRAPKDVSSEFTRGYDILSESKDSKRYIEVKSFATQSEIQISSNEWRTASQYRNDYYLYVVQNLHTQLTPNLFIIKNPFENLAKYMKKVIIEDFRMVLEKLPSDVNYAD